MTLLLSSSLFAQNTLEDTIAIKEVKIESQSLAVPEKQTIDSIALENPGNKDLGEVLARNSYAYVKSYGMGSIATVSLRGAASDHTNLVWNGIQLNSSSNGVVDFSLYPNLFADELQLAYGSNSLLQGSGGIGGVVEMNNRVHFHKKQLISIEQQLGSFDFRTTQLSYQLGNSKFQSVTKVFYRTAENNFTYEDLGVEGKPEKEVDHGSLLQKSFMQSFYFRPSENWRLESHYWYYLSDRDIPNMMTLRDLEENQRDESHRLSFGATKYFEAVTLKAQFAYLEDNLLYQNKDLAATLESHNKSFKSYLDGEYAKNNWTFKSRLNVDYEKAFHPSLKNGVDRTRVSLYAQSQYAFSERLFAQFSFREELIIEELDYFLPSININYRILDKVDWWWRLSAAKNMKYPNLNDLYWLAGGNPNLKAEESKQFELATNYQKSILDWTASFSVALFYADIDNYIQWVPTEFGYWMAENVRLVQTQGIESGMELQRQVKKWTSSLKVKYTYTQSLNQTKDNLQDESLGKQLIYIPEHQANVNLGVNYNNLFINYDWQFVGARYLTSDNDSYLPFYQLSNLSFGKSFRMRSNKLQLQASILNLFDQDYQAIEWRPMPGRNYMVSLKWQLL